MSDIVIRAVTSASPVIKATVSASPVIKPSNAVGPQGIPGPIGENGDVVGPETSVGDNFASWDGTGGNTLKDSGSKASDFATASHNHSGTYLESVVGDTTPQAGGSFDFQAHEAYFSLYNNTTGTVIDWTRGNKQTVAPTTDPTYTFTAPGGACSLQLKITQHSSAVTITWPAAVKWCGSTPDFATNSAVYIVSMFYDGTNYWATSVEEV